MRKTAIEKTLAGIAPTPDFKLTRIFRHKYKGYFVGFARENNNYSFYGRLIQNKKTLKTSCCDSLWFYEEFCESSLEEINKELEEEELDKIGWECTHNQ
jgi:hypothetical protein